MKNGLPYYKAYPRDFIEGTIGMSFELKGAYRLVLDLIYMQGGQLPDDHRYISGLLGCSVRAWKKYREALIASGKIVAENGVISNFRADKELESLAKLQEKQRENRSRPNKNNNLQSRRSDHTEPESDIEKREDKSSQKKGSRLPENWVLPKDWGEWAIKQGWTEHAIRDQADNFRDYWIAESGAKAVKRDWFATWRVWMRRSGKRLKPIQGGGDGKPSKSEQRAMAFIAGAVGEPPGVDRGEGLDPSQPLLARR